MLESRTGHDVAVEARMMRTAFRGSILILEGDTDARFFERFTEESLCRVLPAHGKEKAVEAISLLLQDGFSGALAVVDADFQRILNQDCPSGVCLTDHHDLEILLVESKALEAVVSEYGSKEKLAKRFRSNAANSIRSILYRCAKPIGLLRLCALKEKVSLKFEGLKFQLFVNRDTLKLDVDKLLPRLLSNSRFPVSKEWCEKAMASCTQGQDSRQLCCGHDVVEILSIGLRHAIGSLADKRALPQNVASVLRLAFDSSDLERTELYACIREWEARNPPYVILRQR